jgi:hypothetical protein
VHVTVCRVLQRWEGAGLVRGGATLAGHQGHVVCMLCSSCLLALESRVRLLVEVSCLYSSHGSSCGSVGVLALPWSHQLPAHAVHAVLAQFACVDLAAWACSCCKWTAACLKGSCHTCKVLFECWHQVTTSISARLDGTHSSGLSNLSSSGSGEHFSACSCLATTPRKCIFLVVAQTRTAAARGFTAASVIYTAGSAVDSRVAGLLVDLLGAPESTDPTAAGAKQRGGA